MGLKRITDLTVAGTLDGSEVLELSQLSTTVTITATTISAAASDNSYNDSGSGFVAAGFAQGDRINVVGFTGDTANNIYTGVITAITTSKITIGGADGDVIVDDAAGESVTITKWESKRITANNLVAGLLSSYDIRFGFVDTPTTAEVIDTIPIVRDIRFPADFSGSVGNIDTNPTSSFVLTVKDDTVTIGTITISTGGAFTFATVSNTEKLVAAGSTLTVEAPGSADATAAGCDITLLGNVNAS